jgi:hypothetical protein
MRLMVDSRLFNHWILKSKEDSDVRVYTPKKAISDTIHEAKEDSFEIKPDGKFIKYEISSSGSPVAYTGRYEIEGDTLYTYFDNHYLDSMFRIVELGDNILKIT